MSNIFYKFKSAKDFDIYKFEGMGIPTWELKREIILAKKLGKATDFELVLTDAQSGIDYADDMAIIQRNSQVVVKRLPVASAGHRARTPYGGGNFSMAPPFHHGQSQVGSPRVQPFVASDAPGDEARQIRAMMAASSSHWEQSQNEMYAAAQQQGSSLPRRPLRPAVPAGGRGGPVQMPPDSYSCYRCGQKGHYIQNCSTSTGAAVDRTRIRKTTGIPKSFLKPAPPSAAGEAGDGAQVASSSALLMTEEGSLVFAAPNEQEWDRLTSIKSLASTTAHMSADVAIPDALKCPICTNLLNGAVSPPCCSAAFCDDCLQRLLDDAAAPPCPSCGTPIASAAQVAPNEDYRDRVTAFIECNDAFLLRDEETHTRRAPAARSSNARRPAEPPRGGAPPAGPPPPPWWFLGGPHGLPPLVRPPFGMPPPFARPPFMPPPPMAPMQRAPGEEGGSKEAEQQESKRHRSSQADQA